MLENFRANVPRICLFGFPEMLVMGSATTAARKVVSFSTLIGPFIAIRDYFLRGESDLCGDVWPAMDGMVCLSILLVG